MNRDRPQRRSGRVRGSRVVIAGAVFVLLITVYVMVRIVQTSGPGPDPDRIPERPGTSGG